MARIVVLARALYAHTVWGRPDEHVDRSAPRIFTPLFYGAFLFYGWLGAIYGVPALHDAQGQAFSAAYSVWQIGMVIIAFIMFAFPSRNSQWVELFFLVLLIAQVSIYTYVLIGYALSGDDDRASAVGLTLFVFLCSSFRLKYVLLELQNYRVREEIERQEQALLDELS